MLCGDNGPRYRTRRELVQLFRHLGVTIEDPNAGSRRQLAMAGLEALVSRPDGMANIVTALAHDAPEVSARAERATQERSTLLEDVLEQIRRRFGDVITRPRPPIGRGTFRPCFRLTLRENGSAWLDAHLQSTSDPSLVVPLEEVAGQNASAFAFGRRTLSPAAAVMAALIRASTIFPPIERIRPSRPWTKLDEEELGFFVGLAARELTRADFGVVLPTELTTAGRRRLRLHAQVGLEQPVDGLTSGLNANTLANFTWEAAIDEEILTPDEFEAISNAKRELVRWRERWVLVDERDIANAKIVIGTSGTLPLTRATAAVLAGDASIDGRRATVVPDEALRSLVDRLTDATEPVAPREPEGFVGTLRPYQARGVSWLAHLESSGFGGCLADDMGLGKTIMIIALALHDPRPTLVVCPTSVIGNWEREISRFAPSLEVVRHHGPGRARTAAALEEQLGPRTVVLTSYGLLRRDRALFGAIRFGRAVLDEAQNIKNPAAQQTRAARALDAQSRLALTGTPVENRMTDLWSIMEFSNAGLLGPSDEFIERFAGPVERGDTDATERLRRIVRPFVLRRLKSDPAVAPDLPEKFVSSVVCPLTPEQATLYRATVDEALDAIASAEGIKRRGNILALITSLKQICDHPAVFLKQSGPLAGRSGKLARVTAMLEEVVAEDQAALVFTQYVTMGRLLKEHLRETLGIEPMFLHGGTSRSSRDRMVERFQRDDGPPVFILSLRAGGTGLNLTRATHVFHFDRWWNPAVEDQATDRTHRIGQTKKVMVHALTVSGTLEERIADLLERKRDLAERIVGAGEGWITELSDRELKDLVTLSTANVTKLS